VTAKRLVAVLVAALLAYFAIIGYRGVFLLGEDSWRLKVLGGAVLVLPLVGAWVVAAEIRFGLATERLGAQLDAEGAPPDPDLPRTAGGRIDRDAADALFEIRRAEVEADRAQWRAWYRLAVAYDLAGDRRRARDAMRTAVALASEEGGVPPSE
jgi:Flp pilus assembly protein TadD